MLWKRCYPRAITVKLPIGIALQFFGNGVKSHCSPLCGVVRTHVINNYTLAVFSSLLYNNQTCCCFYYLYCTGPESYTSVWGYRTLLLKCKCVTICRFIEAKVFRQCSMLQCLPGFSRKGCITCGTPQAGLPGAGR